MIPFLSEKLNSTSRCVHMKPEKVKLHRSNISRKVKKVKSLFQEKVLNPLFHKKVINLVAQEKRICHLCHIYFGHNLLLQFYWNKQRFISTTTHLLRNCNLKKMIIPKTHSSAKNIKTSISNFFEKTHI